MVHRTTLVTKAAEVFYLVYKINSKFFFYFDCERWRMTATKSNTVTFYRVESHVPTANTRHIWHKRLPFCNPLWLHDNGTISSAYYTNCKYVANINSIGQVHTIASFILYWISATVSAAAFIPQQPAELATGISQLSYCFHWNLTKFLVIMLQ